MLSMKSRLSLTMVLVILWTLAPAVQARHHKVSQWLSGLSSESRGRLHAAKKEALKDPAVRAASERKKQADAEYRELLHREMLRRDPSLKPLLEKITKLQEKNDF